MDNLEQALLESENSLMLLSDEELITPINDILIINPETRLIEVPSTELLLGVFGENLVEKKYFKCPRIILNNIDLYECFIFINYVSASGRIGSIQSENVELDETEQYILFDWDLTNNVFDKNKDSTIYFSVSAKQYLEDSEPVFATRKAQGKMYETVNGTEHVTQEHADIILQILAGMKTKVDLPKDEDGNLLVPEEGQTLLFKEDGTTYYGTPSSGGGTSFSGSAKDVTYDDTETKLGAENVQDAIGKLSEEKVDLPKDAEGNLIAPTEGQTLLFRADGTTYYGTPTAIDGGGDSGGGEDTEEPEEIVTELELTFVRGGLSGGIFTPSESTMTRWANNPPIDGTKTDTKVVFSPSTDYLNSGNVISGIHILLYSDSDCTVSAGGYVFETGTIKTFDNSLGYQTLNVDTEYIIPSGYYIRIFVAKQTSGTINFTSNANGYSYCTGGFIKAWSVSQKNATSTANLIDDDYAMDYVVATTSLVTEIVGDTTTFEGVLETAKNEWMLAYGGDINKIPLIIHTDQHGHLNRSETIGDVFDKISEMVNWYDISKVINLGDTANSYENPTDLTAGSTSLEKYLDAMSEVPFSKRIEIFGNHDVMYMDGSVLTSIYHDQSYLNPYFRNIYARKTSNNGYFAIKDDNFNVKYVVISGFEFDENYPNKYVMSSEQHEWMIKELEKADGYDVIILSHVPLTGTAGTVDLSPIASARKSKTSGTITDRYGVVHSYDFSGCDGELICSLHGHEHVDGSGYYGSVPYATFQNFYASPRCLYFVLVDRANEQLNIWKVDSTPQYQNFQIPFTQVTE